MKNSLLGAVAAFAFVATGVAAMAQEGQRKEGQHQENRAAERSPTGAPKGAEAPKAERAQTDEMRKQETPRAAQTERQEPNGATPKETTPRAAEKEPAPKAAETERRGPNGAAQKEAAPRAAEGERRNPTGDAERDNKRAAEGEQRRTEGAERKDATRGEPSRADKGGATPGGHATPRIQGVRISSEHAVRIGDTLRRDARPQRPSFDVRVGTRVPEDFAIRPLPPEIVEFEPDYRGYDYFIDDNDEIVFVSPETHEIVGTIEYEGRAASVDAPRGARPCPTED